MPGARKEICQSSFACEVMFLGCSQGFPAYCTLKSPPCGYTTSEECFKSTIKRDLKSEGGTGAPSGGALGSRAGIVQGARPNPCMILEIAFVSWIKATTRIWPLHLLPYLFSWSLLINYTFKVRGRCYREFSPPTTSPSTIFTNFYFDLTEDNFNKDIAPHARNAQLLSLKSNCAFSKLVRPNPNCYLYEVRNDTIVSCPSKHWSQISPAAQQHRCTRLASRNLHPLVLRSSTEQQCDHDLANPS